MKKVEIIVEATALDRIVELVEESGASGYTVVPEVIGMGKHGMRDEAHVTNVFRNSLVIVVATEEVAAKIVECTRPVLDRYAGFIYLTEAEIP